MLSADNTVNMELIAVSAGKEMHYRYATQYVPAASQSRQGWFARTDGATAAWAKPSVKLDLGRQTALSVQNNPRQWIGTDGVAHGSGGRGGQGAHDAVVPETRAVRELLTSPQAGTAGVSTSACWTIPQTIYYNKREHFVTTQTMSGIPETVTESASATHTLGVAYKSSYGSWGANGSMSMSRSGSVSVSQTKSSSYTIYNRVNYRDYDLYCGNGTYDGTYRQPYSFYDLLTNDGSTASKTWFYHCGHHSAGQTWDTGSATNTTYAGGVDLSILNLSAQSGYGRSLNLHYKFKVAGQVCGSNPLGPASSSRVEADIYG